MTQLHFSVAWLALSIGLCLSTPAVTGQTPARAKATATHTGLTCDDVIKLAKAGLAEDIIIQQIKKNGHAFDLSTDQLVALKTAHVSDALSKSCWILPGPPPSLLLRPFQNPQHRRSRKPGPRLLRFTRRPAYKSRIDSSSGRQYKIDNHSDYRWVNKQWRDRRHQNRYIAWRRLAADDRPALTVAEKDLNSATRGARLIVGARVCGE